MSGASGSSSTTTPPSGDTIVGKPLNRVDGPLKVSGNARYAAEFRIPRIAHAVAVLSTVANGRIASFDSSDAEKLPGVLAVISYKNAQRLKDLKGLHNLGGQLGQSYVPLQDDAVHYAGQYIGLVVAETIEQARQAAEAVKVEYDAQPPAMNPLQPVSNRTPEHGSHGPAHQERGDAQAALDSAAVKITGLYITPPYTHNPMETHATIAHFQGSKLTLYDATQHVDGVRSLASAILEMPQEMVRVIDPFVGGAFGNKGSMWPNTYLAALAARTVNRPVKFQLSRRDMFTQVGHRPWTHQQISLGADEKGNLVSIIHDTINWSSVFDHWGEQCSADTAHLYSCPNVRTSQKIAQVNIGTPCQMRAPGHCPGVFALEVAMDELAYACKLDPLELRLRNYAETDEGDKRPYTSKSLKACYEQASEKFGWRRRNPEPRSMRDGNELIGWGMATATYPAGQGGCSADARLLPDGTAVISLAAHDIGTGTYTILTQIAAQVLGLPPRQVRVELADTNFPRAPGEGGSTQAVSAGSAVKIAAEALVQKIAELATGDKNGPFGEQEADKLAAKGGNLVSTEDATLKEPLIASIKRNGGQPILAHAQARPDADLWHYSKQAFGCDFVEVRVRQDTGEIRLSRIVAAFAAGKILNPKTAHSQIMGGIVMGCGMALTEGTVYDFDTGKVVTNNLADYLVPVNKDIPPIDCFFVEETDRIINSLGAKGIGEIGITGIAAAIANAIFHATGKRVRELPIRLDAILA